MKFATEAVMGLVPQCKTNASKYNTSIICQYLGVGTGVGFLVSVGGICGGRAALNLPFGSLLGSKINAVNFELYPKIAPVTKDRFHFILFSSE